MNQRTLYCGKLHRTGDGLPVAHACRVLDPDYLHAERAQEYGRAAALLERMRLVLHGGVFSCRDELLEPHEGVVAVRVAGRR